MDGKGMDLLPALKLFQTPAAAEEVAAAERLPFVTDQYFADPVWDAWSASFFFCCGSAALSLMGDVVTLVAGSEDEEGVDDGSGHAARFNDPAFPVSDGAGTLYVVDIQKIRRIQLPAAWRAAEAGGVAAATAATAAVVTTLPFQAANHVLGLAYLAGRSGGYGCSLVFATRTALYRVPLGGGAGSLTPVLLAGWEGQLGSADGRGVHASFHSIAGLTVEASGCVLCMDRNRQANTTAVRRVAPDGTVITLVAGLEGQLNRPAILPNGYLATCDDTDDVVVVLDLGLVPSPLSVPAASTAVALGGPQPRTLPADLGALLDAQPDGTADLTIVVGDRSFAVHRLILSARCDYFKPRLTAGTFADGSAAQLSLPDADPEAFALLLRFLYTGAADIPAALACAVAELADRLLLPELCADAQAQVLAAVTPTTVVGSLLWAAGCEARCPGFSQLLSDLKAWYVENQHAVRREARDSIRQLMVESPDLALELVEAAEERSVKRARMQ